MSETDKNSKDVLHGAARIDHNAPTEPPSPQHLATTLAGQGSESVSDNPLPVWSIEEGKEIPHELADHPRYQIIKRLGAGGMGEVFLAEHRIMKRAVAIKTINPALLRSAASAERFHREIRAAAMLAHPNIVAAYDAEQAGSLHFLAMEYVEGIDLSRMVKEKGRLSLLRSCHYIRQAAMGLQHACDRGMVHRDIKPHNLILTTKNQLKILDFGLARVASERSTPDSEDQSLTEEGSLMGTADYISPEQATNAKSADIRADIYSLGCTMYQLLTGKVPYPGGSNIEKIMRHVHKPAEPLQELRPEVSDDLNRIVQKMMAKHPDDRFQRPIEIAKALDPIIKSLASSPEEATDPPAPPELEARKGAAEKKDRPSATELGAAPVEVVLSKPKSSEPGVALPPRKETKSAAENSGRVTKLKYKPRGLSWSQIVIGLFLGVGFGVVLMGVLMRKSPTGNLELKSDIVQARVLVRADGNTVAILDAANDHVELREGDYELSLAEADRTLELKPDRLHLERGRRESIVVSKRPEKQEPISKTTKPPLPFADNSQNKPLEKTTPPALPKEPQSNPSLASPSKSNSKSLPPITPITIKTDRNLAIVDADPEIVPDWLARVRNSQMIPVRIRTYTRNGKQLVAGIATHKGEGLHYKTSAKVPSDRLKEDATDEFQNNYRILFATPFESKGKNFFITQWIKCPSSISEQIVYPDEKMDDFKNINSSKEDIRSAMRVSIQAYPDPSKERYAMIDVKTGLRSNARGSVTSFEDFKSLLARFRNERSGTAPIDVSIWQGQGQMRIYHIWSRMQKTAQSQELFLDVPADQLEAKIREMEQAGKVVWTFAPYQSNNKTHFFLVFLAGDYSSLLDDFHTSVARRGGGANKEGTPKKQRKK